MPTFKVTWNKFTVVKKHDIDRDKPYLWVFGIVVDANAMKDRNYVIRRRSDSDNLGKKFKKGDSTSVSSDLDFSREMSSLLPMTAGVVVVAWENGATKDSVIADAYDDAADEINDFVQGLVDDAVDQLKLGVDPEDIDVQPTDAEIEALTEKVEAKVRSTIKAGSSLFQKMLHDHNIGTQQMLVSLCGRVQQNLDFRFVKGSTYYELEGSMTYDVPVAPPGTVREPTDLPDKLREPKITSTVRR